MTLVLVVHFSLDQVRWLISGTLNFTGMQSKCFAIVLVG